MKKCILYVISNITDLICTYLALSYGDLLTVAKRVDGDAPGSLLVTLLETFLHNTIGPVHSQLLLLGWVAEVSTMNEALQQLHKNKIISYIIFSKKLLFPI